MTEGYSRIRSVRVADHFAKQRDGKSQFNVNFLNANTDPIAADVLNTQYMARSDLNWTDFIYVPKGDLNAFKNFKKKGGESDENGSIPVGNDSYILKGTYRNGRYTPDSNLPPCPIGGGKKMVSLQTVKTIRFIFIRVLIVPTASNFLKNWELYKTKTPQSRGLI